MGVAQSACWYPSAAALARVRAAPPEWSRRCPGVPRLEVRRRPGIGAQGRGAARREQGGRVAQCSAIRRRRGPNCGRWWSGTQNTAWHWVQFPIQISKSSKQLALSVSNANFEFQASMHTSKRGFSVINISRSVNARVMMGSGGHRTKELKAFQIKIIGPKQPRTCDFFSTINLILFN